MSTFNDLLAPEEASEMNEFSEANEVMKNTENEDAKTIERYEAWSARLKELYNDEIRHAELAAEAKRLAKKAKEEREQLLLRGACDYNPDPTPLLTFAESNEDSLDEWRNWKIADHFDLTDATLEKLGLADDSTVGQLSDAIGRINDGEKVKGIGEAALEKISEQFDRFWESEAYVRSINRGSESSDVREALQIIESIEILREINSTADFDFGTFDGIARSVREDRFVTDAQLEALRNIQTAASSFE